ncbi:MAG: HEAT repeat domain-containing protein, partial [bacterium]
MSWFTLQKLKSKDQAARCDAVREIAREGDIEHMLPMLADSSAMVRVVTANELARLHVSAAVEPLSAALKDSDINVRKAAAEALREIKDAAAIPALLEALGDINREVRAAVIAALVSFGPSALDSVIGALGDPDEG